MPSIVRAPNNDFKPRNKYCEYKNVYNSNIKCFNCNLWDHKSAECKNKKVGLKCFKCSKFGHIAIFLTNHSYPDVSVSDAEQEHCEGAMKRCEKQKLYYAWLGRTISKTLPVWQPYTITFSLVDYKEKRYQFDNPIVVLCLSEKMILKDDAAYDVRTAQKTVRRRKIMAFEIE
ncbi:hypothetical protein NPIL_456471 [Nephila pilipes]|uniref:CCHC-type domain-containing protein n=1 Tax=Nephila pilipes TaxID=299642 RepID=A0A8X6PY26_NEPPI|nr:hypothetical protein NPIL_456471 [Nephila pilipes]